MIVSVFIVLINVNVTKDFTRFLHILENKKSGKTSIITMKTGFFLSQVLVVSMP